MRVGMRSCVLLAAAALALSGAVTGQEPGPYERYQRGIAALEAKDPARAIGDLEAAARFFQRDPDVLSALAKAKALSGDADGAIAALTRAVSLGYGAGVALFPLAPSLDRVTGARVLERGHAAFEIPTTGAVAGDTYAFIANSQLRALGPDGVKDPEKRRPVVILELDLPR